MVPAAAQTDQTTWSAESGFEVTGRVLGHDGTFLRLQTEAGPITLNPAGLTCRGTACPPADLPAPTWMIVGAPRIGESLLPSLVEGFAFANGYEAVRSEEAAGVFAYDLTDRVSGALLGRFAFELSSSADGLRSLQSQSADAALHVGEVPKEEIAEIERSGLGDLGSPVQVRVLAHDALVPVVSARAEVAQISLEHLADAFDGTARNWSDIGGPDLPIEPHLDRSDHAAWFEAVVLAGTSAPDAVVRHDGPAELSRAVTTSAGALGVVSFRDWGDAWPLPIAGHCGIRIAADGVSLRTLDYPLTVPLVLLLPDRRRPPLADEFLHWLRTDRAAAVIRRVGFVDLSMERIPIDLQGGRLAEAIARAGQEVTLPELQAMIAAFDGRVRLAPTFRFKDDGMTLDLTSHAWVEEVASQIESGKFDGRTLLLAGFSDGQGPANASRAKSGARAEAVMAALVNALGGSLPDGVRLRLRAFGEALPMGCDDTEWGRRQNRRVELWVDE